MQEPILPGLVLGDVIEQLLEIQPAAATTHFYADLRSSDCIRIVASPIACPLLRISQDRLQAFPYLIFRYAQAFQPPRRGEDLGLPAGPVAPVLKLHNHEAVHEDAVDHGQSSPCLLLIETVLLL
jgi:hypothetical protein